MCQIYILFPYLELRSFSVYSYCTYINPETLPLRIYVVSYNCLNLFKVQLDIITLCSWLRMQMVLHIIQVNVCVWNHALFSVETHIRHYNNWCFPTTYNAHA